MPARNLYHNAIKSALIRDNWAILADPYWIKYKDVDLYADLAAERPIAIEREGQKIVVEIKSFVGRSLMTDFHQSMNSIWRSMTLPTTTFSNVRTLNFSFDPVKSSFL